MLSLLLMDVPVEPIAGRLWPTLEAMALQVLERLAKPMRTPGIRQSARPILIGSQCGASNSALE
jgi:hypothetical protein